MNNDLNKDKKTKKVYKYKTKDGIILTKEDHFNLFKFLCPYQKPRKIFYKIDIKKKSFQKD